METDVQRWQVLFPRSLAKWVEAKDWAQREWIFKEFELCMLDSGEQMNIPSKNNIPSNMMERKVILWWWHVFCRWNVSSFNQISEIRSQNILEISEFSIKLTMSASSFI